jgi:hypothetical protein
MTGAKALAWRNRILSLAIVGLYIGLVHVLVDDPLLRARINYGVVITLGYGHLVGAAYFARKRLLKKLVRPTRYVVAHTGRAGVRLARSSQTTQHFAWFLFFMVASGLAYAGYSALLTRSPGFWLPMLAISIWHTVENSQGLEGAYRSQLQMPALTRDPKSHLIALGGSVCLLGWAIILLQPKFETATLTMRILTLSCGAFLLIDRQERPATKWAGLALIAAGSLPPHWFFTSGEVEFSDLFTVSILYHLISWGTLSIEKSRRSDAPIHMKRDMAVIHLLPLGILLSTYAWPASLGSSLRADFFAPATYLFWSVVHVLQTAWLRGRSEPRRH